MSATIITKSEYKFRISVMISTKLTLYSMLYFL